MQSYHMTPHTRSLPNMGTCHQSAHPLGWDYLLLELLSRWSLFLFTTHAQLFLSISLSLISLIPFIRITFLFLLLYYHHVPSFYFSSYDSHQATGRQDCYCALEWGLHYSYCRREGPATFSETFLSGPPKSGLSALSTASSSSTKPWETFSSQQCCTWGMNIPYFNRKAAIIPVSITPHFPSVGTGLMTSAYKKGKSYLIRKQKYSLIKGA